MDSLVNQIAAFEALRERVAQSASAVKQASFLSSAAATSIQQELVKRQQSSPASKE